MRRTCSTSSCSTKLSRRQVENIHPFSLGLRPRNASSVQQHPRCQAAVAIEDAPRVQDGTFKTAAKEMPAPRGGKLKEKATAYIEEHRIRAYEADPNQRTTIVTMSNLLQVILG